MHYRYCIPLLFASWLSLSMLPVRGQLIPDATLGAESSSVVEIAPLQDAIAGGATRGANLFHSFTEFNVGEGRGVYFENPRAIANILTRVTGGNSSDILGQLGVLGEANLWLINPNGIYFGPDASLDVRGSFVATTADGVWLGNTGYFSATDVEGSQLLAIEPGALFHNALAAHQREINNRGNLEVGGDLTLEGGRLDLQGQLSAGGDVTLRGLDEVKIRDTTTSPFIASAVGELSIQGNERVDIFALNHGESGLFSGENMVLASASPVIGDVHYYAGGNFSILNSQTNVLGDLESPFDPVIRAAGDVTLGSYTGASLHILAGGSVNITGDIDINAVDAANGLQETVTLSDGTTVAIDGTATPTLDIRAGTINFNPVGCTGTCPTYTVGGSTSGDITIAGNVTASGGQVFLSNRYFPDLALSGNISVNAIDLQDTSGGSVTIDSRGALSINGLVNASAFSGNGGDIKLLSLDNLTLNPNSELRSNGNVGGAISLESGGDIVAKDSEIISQSNGNIGGLTGGTVRITASQDTSFQNVRISTITFGEGNAGNVTITSQEDFSLSGIGIISPTLGNGNAGNVTITSQGDFSLNESSISSPTLGNGNAGNVTITSQGDSSLSNGSQIGSSAYLNGNAGNVTITSQGDFNLSDRSIIFSSTFGNANAGNVTITSQGNSNLSNRSAISSSTFLGNGNAGNITIITTDTIRIQGEGRFSSLGNGVFSTVEETGTGNAGSIDIQTSRLEILDGAEIATSTKSQGNGGTITILATDSILIQGANSQGRASGVYNSVDEGAIGNGGSISIDTTNLNLLNGARIDSSTGGQGSAGSVNINANTAQITNNAQISVLSQSSGRAGNINLQGENLTLRNNARVTAETANADGGNITLNLQEILLMRHGSSINTTAGTAEAGGNGGNITITAKFVVAVPGENSDITANAFEGDGGNISITANAIYGLTLRDKPTPFSDITASSQFGANGTLVFNSLSFPSEQGLNQLPASLVDAESIIGRDACAFRDGKIAGGNTFTVTGRGGIPTNPEDVLTHSPYVPQWATRQGNEPRSPVVLRENKSEENPIRSVQGWHVSADGTVHLTADASTPTPNAPALAHPTCQDFSA